MNKLTLVIMIVATALLVAACEDWDAYKMHLEDGERVYPAVATNVRTHPGNERLMITWPKGLDSRVQFYRVFWNNNTDSAQIDTRNIPVGDTIRLLIPQIEESSYTFTVFSYDAFGNKSVPKELSAISVYGNKYRNALLNRPVNSYTYIDSTHLLTLNYGVADTVHINTKIQYQDTTGKVQSTFLDANASTISLYIKSKSSIIFNSSYKPSQMAIDTFWVSQLDSLSFQ